MWTYHTIQSHLLAHWCLTGTLMLTLHRVSVNWRNSVKGETKTSAVGNSTFGRVRRWSPVVAEADSVGEQPLLQLCGREQRQFWGVEGTDRRWMSSDIHRLFSCVLPHKQLEVDLSLWTACITLWPSECLSACVCVISYPHIDYIVSPWMPVIFYSVSYSIWDTSVSFDVT